MHITIYAFDFIYNSEGFMYAEGLCLTPKLYPTVYPNFTFHPQNSDKLNIHINNTVQPSPQRNLVYIVYIYKPRWYLRVVR